MGHGLPLGFLVSGSADGRGTVKMGKYEVAEINGCRREGEGVLRADLMSLVAGEC